MLKDPEQKNDISGTELKIIEYLKAEYTNWFDEVRKVVKPESSIPIDKNWNFMELPTYEASFSGNKNTKKDMVGYTIGW